MLNGIFANSCLIFHTCNVRPQTIAIAKLVQIYNSNKTMVYGTQLTYNELTSYYRVYKSTHLTSTGAPHCGAPARPDAPGPARRTPGLLGEFIGYHVADVVAVAKTITNHPASPHVYRILQVVPSGND